MACKKMGVRRRKEEKIKELRRVFRRRKEIKQTAQRQKNGLLRPRMQTLCKERDDKLSRFQEVKNRERLRK